jgi:hypothetical protein
MEILASKISKQGSNPPLHLQQRQFERFLKQIDSRLIAELYVATFKSRGSHLRWLSFTVSIYLHCSVKSMKCLKTLALFAGNARVIHHIVDDL